MYLTVEMLIQFTLCGLIILLIAVIALSYYANKEGFDNMKVSLLQNEKPATIVIQPKHGSLVDLCFKEGETNAMAVIEQSKCPAGSKYPYQINKLTSINTSPSFSPGECSFSRNQQNTPEAQRWNLMYLGDCNNEPQYWKQVATANTAGSISNISPTPSASSTPAPASSTTPQRNVVVPQVSISDTGYNAMELQQKTDLLKDIQKIVRNEILANRMTTPMMKDKNSTSDNDDEDESDSTMQGKEYESNCQKMNGGEEEYRCPKNPDGSCPPVPDMTQYIKKDAIPCWGCSIQY